MGGWAGHGEQSTGPERTLFPFDSNFRTFSRQPEKRKQKREPPDERDSGQEGMDPERE